MIVIIDLVDQRSQEQDVDSDKTVQHPYREIEEKSPQLQLQTVYESSLFEADK